MDAVDDTAPWYRSTGWRSRVTPRSIQIALGGIWILDGVLQLQPSMFGRGFVTSVLLPNAQGQPAPLAWSIDSLAHFVSPDIALWNLLFGAVQLLIGIGLLFRPAVKPAIVATAVWAFGVWWFGEGFGMLLTGTACPLTGAPGAVLLYPVIGFLVWPTRHRQQKTSVGLRSSAGAAGPLGMRAALGAWVGFWTLSALLWLLPANRTAERYVRRFRAQQPANRPGTPTDSPHFRPRSDCTRRSSHGSWHLFRWSSASVQRVRDDQGSSF